MTVETIIFFNNKCISFPYYDDDDLTFLEYSFIHCIKKLTWKNMLSILAGFCLIVKEVLAGSTISGFAYIGFAILFSEYAWKTKASRAQLPGPTYSPATKGMNILTHPPAAQPVHGRTDWITKYGAHR